MHVFDAPGLPRRDQSVYGTAAEPFPGAVFPADGGGIELQSVGPQMPAGAMLQIVARAG